MPCSSAHVPVMATEVVSWLLGEPRMMRNCGRYIDATLGAGGHTEALLMKAPGSEILGIDRDPQARGLATARLERWKDRVHIVAGTFGEIAAHLQHHGWSEVDGIVADLGVASFQLDRASRGFSFMRSGPLDMRMDPTAGMSAAEWIARVSEAEMTATFFRFGEERHAHAIARRICERRKLSPLLTTEDLADEVVKVVPRTRGVRLHPATRIFQAIRIAINHELDELESFLRDAPRCLTAGGRLVMISYHSLEDRLVKHTFREWSERGYRLPVRKALRPQEKEVAANPRARSAKLRVLERMAA